MINDERKTENCVTYQSLVLILLILDNVINISVIMVADMTDK